MTKYIIKIVCCFLYIGIVKSAPPPELPKGFIQCKLSDPNLNECIKNGLQKATPHLTKGIPSLSLLPTDPLRITSLVIDQGAGAVQLKMKYKDLDIKNMRTTTIKELNYNPKNYTFHIALEVKKPVVLEGLYESNGKVLILPITGNGTCKITLDNYKSYSIVQMKPVVRNGVTYLKVQNLSWKFTTSRLHLKFDNLFNGDKILEYASLNGLTIRNRRDVKNMATTRTYNQRLWCNSIPFWIDLEERPLNVRFVDKYLKMLRENMNVFLNENWMELLNEMQPAFEEALSAAFISISQKFFDRIPLNQIFID